MTTLNKEITVCANCALIVESDYACSYCSDYKGLMSLTDYEMVYGEFLGY